MSRYVGDIIWPTIFFAAIFIPVLLTFMPYITSGVPYNIQSSITSQLSSVIENPMNALSTFVLGDLAPYLYALVISLLIVYRKDLTKVKENLGLTWDPKSPYIAPSILVPILILTWLFLSGVFPLIISLSASDITNFLVVLYTLFPVAISEELIFRGFILTRLLPKSIDNNVIKALGKSIIAIIISALYFAMAHVPIYAAMYGLNNVSSLMITIALIFIYGIIAGIIYVITGSVLFDIVLHWLNDLLALIAVVSLGNSLTLHIILIPLLF